MSSRHLSFESEDPDLSVEPLTFDLTFRRFTGPEGNGGPRPSERVTETFTCKPFVTAGVLVGVEAMWGASRSAKGGGAALDLLDAALVEEDRRRFRQLLDDPDAYLDGKVIGRVIESLYGWYMARPTVTPASS